MVRCLREYWRTDRFALFRSIILLDWRLRNKWPCAYLSNIHIHVVNNLGSRRKMAFWQNHTNRSYSSISSGVGLIHAGAKNSTVHVRIISVCFSLYTNPHMHGSHNTLTCPFLHRKIRFSRLWPPILPDPKSASIKKSLSSRTTSYFSLRNTRRRGNLQNLRVCHITRKNYPEQFVLCTETQL